jgi:hypothetical protein
LAAEGFYTAEPIFAAVIRRARELGFDVFGYEADGWSLPSMTAAERANAREQGQARNLQREIARWPKKEKFVIFAGFAHIRNDFLMRGPATGDVRSMASYLAQWTGIDPLSVDLTACAYAAPEPETVQGRIFLQANGRPLISAGYAGSVDGQIRLPVSDGKSVSPGYYRHLLGIAVEVPNGLHPQDEAVLVEAREVDGDINAIAYDRILLRPGERFPLYLKAGREFELVSYAASGALRGRARVHVGGNEHRH